MKAKELRIGNLVQFEGEFYHIAAIQCDETIRLKCEDSTHRNYCHGTIGCYGMYSIDPIPLTEEWLVKFGFKMNMDNFNWNAGIGVNCIGDFELSLRYTDNIGWFYRSKCSHIKYVHQLQNLYFAITGEELTIGGNNE